MGMSLLDLMDFGILQATNQGVYNSEWGFEPEIQEVHHIFGTLWIRFISKI